MSLVRVSLFLSSVFFVLNAFSFFEIENMGQFRFVDYALSPQMQFTQPNNGGFLIKESWLGFEWKKEESLFSQIKIGSYDLVKPALWFEKRSTDFAIVEAWIEGRSSYVNLRAGLVPTLVGYEGTHPEWSLMLPQTKWFGFDIFPRRDFGLQFISERSDLMTALTIHNGESSTNADGKMWASGVWLYEPNDGWGGQLSAVVAATTGLSTEAQAPAISALGFAMDPTLENKLRYGQLALFYKSKNVFALLESGRGDHLQGENKFPFASGHFDLSFHLTGDLSLMTRIEKNQTDLYTKGTISEHRSVGFLASDQYKLVSTSLWYTQNKELVETQNDELQLIFKIHSSILQ